METLFPTVEHRYCVTHIYNNFKVNHKGMELKSVLWRCAGTTSVSEFERGMDHLKSLDEQAYDFNPIYFLFFRNNDHLIRLWYF